VLVDVRPRLDSLGESDSPSSGKPIETIFFVSKLTLAWAQQKAGGEVKFEDRLLISELPPSDLCVSEHPVTKELPITSEATSVVSFMNPISISSGKKFPSSP
jgi:hypothetical protein